MADKASAVRSAWPSSFGMSPMKLPTDAAPSAAASNLRLGAELALHPFLHHRLRHDPHIEFGIEAAADALDHHHGLLQQQQFGARLHVEDFGILEELAEQLRHGDLARRAVHDRLADGAQGLREQLDRMLARHIACLEMHLGDAAVVAVEEAVQDLGEEAPLLYARAGP